MSATLRCGVQGLPAAESALVRTLFKLYQHGAGNFRWRLVDAAPYDAILIDANSPHLATEHGHEGVKAVFTLPRPLRSEMLAAWLAQTQQTFFAEGQTTTPVPAAPTPGTIRQPAQAEAAVAPATRAEAWKLMRWPPAAMLRNDPTLIRMATVLSRRAMTVSELAQVSQQAPESAQAFVLAMRDAGLLVSPAPKATAAVASKPDPEISPRAPRPPRKTERSLMNRIRLRLGL